MSYKPNDPYYRIFSITNSSGSLVNADSTPSGVVNKNGVDDPSFGINVSNLSIGRYVVSGFFPGTYAKGNVVNIGVYAIVSGIRSYSNLDEIVMDSLRVGDLNNFNPAGTAVTVSGGSVNSVTNAIILPANPQVAVTGLVFVGDKTGFSLAATQSFNNTGQTTAASVSGNVNINLSQSIPSPQTSGTVGFSLAGAEATAAGKWTISGTTFNVYRWDGTLLRQFTLDSSGNPTQRA